MNFYFSEREMMEGKGPPELEFDQTERITSRLRDLVRNYPKGLGLVKEFLQNADDAGASKLVLIYDRRLHSGSTLNAGMNVTLGPSLLFVNDQVFTDEDFQRIQQIGEGGKIRDAARTGRFGQGFNTSYSASDHPSLLTGPRIAWFDPHHRAFDKGKNAYAWKLADVESAWPCWVKTFEPAGWSPGISSFPCTAFRLPLRSVEDAAQSEILQEPFLDADFDSILHELKQVGAALLIFLRSINSFEVREISPDGVEKLRFSLSTINTSEVEQSRSILRNAVAGKPNELLNGWLNSTESLPVVHFTHSFSIYDIDYTEREETWEVISGLFRGPENSLIHSALDVWEHQEKAIPWAGAAVCRSTPAQGVRPGGLACFLPLPEKTSWQVWLNGWFDLSSNRRSITRSADVGETTSARYAWNKSLMKHAVGEAWASLVWKVGGQVKENSDPYVLWPRSSNTLDEVDESLLAGFYGAAAKLPVIRGLNAKGHFWSKLGDGALDLAKGWHDQLVEPFLAEGWTIIDPPLPHHVRAGFHKTEYKIPTIDSKSLREELSTDEDIACALEDAPRPMLANRDWICSLAKFCASDWGDLKQLPLALLADNLLHTFSKCGPLYLVSEEEQELLAPLPHRRLDKEFQDKIGLDEPAEDINVVKLDVNGLLDCIPHVLRRGPADAKWLISIFTYLTARSTEEVKLHKEKLKDLELIPDQNGNWCKMGYINTPLIPGELSIPLHQALTRLGIPLLEGSEELVSTVRLFASKHTGFLWHLTPDDLADNLKAHIEKPTLNEKALDEPAILQLLLDFLTSSNWLKKDDERLPLLRKFRILPTTCGQRVAAETPNVYVPGGFHPPAGVGSQYLVLDTGHSNQWLELLKALEIPTLEGKTFVEKVLLPSFSNVTREQHYRFLVWLRDEFRFVERELDEDKRKQLRRKIQQAPILPIEGGGLAAPREVYRPDAEEPQILLGKLARAPDKEFFASQQDLWAEFFEEFRLPRRPLARDLLDAIRNLIGEAKSSGANAVRDTLRKLVAHIRERWPQLSEFKLYGEETVGQELSQLAWLPATSEENAAYPACAKWQDRLWRADELVPARLANLVASKRPVLDGPEFPEAMSKSLGLITQVAPGEVLDHFSAVRKIPLDDGAVTKVQRAATEIYRFIGQIDFSLIQNLPAFKSLQTEPSILVGGHWRSPNRCFLEPLPFSTNSAFSLTGTGINLDQPFLKGVERLGVRPRPSDEDWLQMLWDLAEEFNHGVLSPNALNQARQALRCLRAAPSDWLSEKKVLVPLIDGRLEEARHSLIPDDSRLNRIECLNSLPLIEDNEDALDVGLRAGAKSLHGELIDRLKELPKLTQNPRFQSLATQIEQRVKSNHFYQSLRRLAYEEALGKNDANPRAAASLPDLELPQRLKITIAPAIQVESVVTIQEEDVIAFEINATSFLDDTTPRIWLKEGSNRKIRDELVRALCKLCGLSDQLRLSRVLEAEPEQMAKLLDEEEVARLPEGQTLDLNNGARDFAIETKECEYLTESLSLAPIEEKAEEYSDDESNPGYYKSEPFEEEATPGFSSGLGVPQTTDFPPSGESNIQNNKASASHTGNHQYPAREGTAPIPPTSFEGSTLKGHSQAFAGGADEQKPARLPSPPINPGHGSSTFGGPPPANDSDQKKQVRLRSYVHKREQSDYDTGEAEPRAKEIGDIGESIVLEWEMEQGRTAQLMPPNNEGYDIESKCSEGTRYIEVKSIERSWGGCGVGVTRAQYNAAMRLGHAWWLYVVENATDKERAVVHAIQNPFYQATEYRFDAGWQEAQTNATEPPEIVHPILGAKYEKPDGNLVRIIQTTQRGSLWRVKVETENGSDQIVPWNPNWRRI